mmetsp:Transcript_12992/g.30906  ORF Transcript_12992/g.30906 Transcript_12992/m.30906 type:complete len:212 (-) Transcript_12992:263-898(-)
MQASLRDAAPRQTPSGKPPQMEVSSPRRPESGVARTSFRQPPSWRCLRQKKTLRCEEQTKEEPRTPSALPCPSTSSWGRRRQASLTRLRRTQMSRRLCPSMCCCQTSRLMPGRAAEASRPPCPLTCSSARIPRCQPRLQQLRYRRRPRGPQRPWSDPLWLQSPVRTPLAARTRMARSSPLPSGGRGSGAVISASGCVKRKSRSTARCARRV